MEAHEVRVSPRELLLLVRAYLRDHGYHAACAALEEESSSALGPAPGPLNMLPLADIVSEYMRQRSVAAARRTLFDEAGGVPALQAASEAFCDMLDAYRAARPPGAPRGVGGGGTAPPASHQSPRRSAVWPPDAPSTPERLHPAADSGRSPLNARKRRPTRNLMSPARRLRTSSALPSQPDTLFELFGPDDRTTIEFAERIASEINAHRERGDAPVDEVVGSVRDRTLPALVSTFTLGSEAGRLGMGGDSPPDAARRDPEQDSTHASSNLGFGPALRRATGSDLHATSALSLDMGRAAEVPAEAVRTHAAAPAPPATTSTAADSTAAPVSATDDPPAPASRPAEPPVQTATAVAGPAGVGDDGSEGGVPDDLDIDEFLDEVHRE